MNTIASIFEPINAWASQILAGIKTTDREKINELIVALKIEYPFETEEYLANIAKQILNKETNATISTIYEVKP